MFQELIKLVWMIQHKKDGSISSRTTLNPSRGSWTTLTYFPFQKGSMRESNGTPKQVYKHQDFVAEVDTISKLTGYPF